MSGAVYFDSSALVAIYVAGPFSARVRSEVVRFGAVAFTPLHDLEVRNAFRALHGRKALSAAQRTELERLLDLDLRAGRLASTSLDLAAVFLRAEQLSAAHTSKLLCRSLDILHVAAALELRRAELVSADERQLHLAATVGLKAIDVRS